MEEKPFPHNLTRPLQAIIIVKDLIDRTIDGTKIVTVREGWRDYKPGKVIVACPEVDWCCMKEIIEVKHTTLDQMEESDYKAEGWVNRSDILTSLKNYYSNMSEISKITVVRWR